MFVCVESLDVYLDKIASCADDLMVFFFPLVVGVAMADWY